MGHSIAAAAFLAVAVAVSAQSPAMPRVKLATTTSTEQSGLLGAILPAFEKETGYRVDVIAVGTGASLKIGEKGDCDVVLVHARALEDAFMAAGFGAERRDVMYNDFIVLGPAADPAGVAQAASAADAFARIAGAGTTFVSRGDNSGTHVKEREVWKAAGLAPAGPWYKEAGQGMSQVIAMSEQMGGYTLADRGTWLAMKDRSRLRILAQGDKALFNPYGIITVSAVKWPGINSAGAKALAEWMTGPRGRALIAAYKIGGEQCFYLYLEAFRLLSFGDAETWGIVWRSLRFALLSTLFSVLPGLPIGAALASLPDSRTRRLLAAAAHSLTAVPTVVIGLAVYSLISRSGPLGSLGFLFAPAGVVIGQAFLATPVVASLTYTGLAKLDPRFHETLATLGAGAWARISATLREARAVLVAALVVAFGRVTGEVGVSMMLGGNIRFSTRTMTTAIALDAAKGEFDRAVSLGLVLLVIALTVNLALHALAPHET